MKFCGVDLAAKEKNPTGLAMIDGKKVRVWTIHTDEEIIEKIIDEKPVIVAIDAPLTTRVDRYADKYLRKYGALSLKIPAMMTLAKRALNLVAKLNDTKVIEVFPTATAKILGFYRKNKMEMLSFFSSFILPQVKNEHEVDAIIAAYTAYLHSKGETEIVDGVVIPRLSPEFRPKR